jgi:tetratricopeptide (TPR) repeat protein
VENTNIENTFPRQRPKFRFSLACVLSVIFLFLAYSNHFHNDFHFDDSNVIEENLYIRSLNNIPTLFTDARTYSRTPEIVVYRPMVMVTYAIDYWLSGELDPWQFHVTQFILLLLLGLGLVCLFLKLMNQVAVQPWNQYAALFAALLFGVHTANTTTINYISARSDLFSTLFVVVAFLVYLYFPKLRRFHLFLVPMILGALAKVPAVIFAPILFMYILFFEKGLSLGDLFSSESWPQIKSAIGYTLPTFITGILLFWFCESMNPPTQTYGGGSRLDYLLTQAYVWLHYLKLFFLPIGLTADTDLELLPHWYDTRFFAGLGAIAILVYIAWKSSKRPELRIVAFGIVWFGLALLPASSFFPLAEVENEHRIFFPYIGLTLALVWWLALTTSHWLKTRPHPMAVPAVFAIALLILGGHAIGTYQRNKAWLSSETLWGDVVEKSPANGRAWMNYGLTKMSQGKYQEARTLFERARTHAPNYPTLEVNLGIVTSRLGDGKGAEQHFLRALSLNPHYVEGSFFYARWLVDQGRSNLAITHLKRAIEWSPGHPHARLLLMRLYAAKGDVSNLKTLAEEILVLSPNDTVALAYAKGEIPVTVSQTAREYLNRGFALTNRGQHLDAALLYRQALKIDPNFPDAYNNLGWSLAKMGFYSEAFPAFEQAVRIQPGYSRAIHNLAWARTQLALVKE